MRQRPLLIFAGSMLLLQLANAAMLPLMAGVVTTRSSQWAPVLIAACIIVPQAIVALASPSVGRKAQQWGRRPLLLLGFAALAIRGVLFATVSDPYLLVAVQVFDGITAAVFSVMVPLIVADVAFGSGHFNLAQGIVGTATGIGASLSTVLAGYVSDKFGSSVAFTGLAGVAAMGLAMIWFVMPETRRATDGHRTQQRALGRHRLPIQRAVAGRRNVPAERSRHRIAAHRVQAILGHEGRERAPDAAEKRFGRRLREQKSGFAVRDGFRQPAGLVADRQRSEFLRVHLAQSARLEARRHQGKIAAGKNPPRLAVIEADGDPDRIGPAAVRIDQRLFDLGLAAAGHDDLSAGLDDLVRGRQHEVDAFLMNQPGHQAEDRTARQRQTELLADVIGSWRACLPSRPRQTAAPAGRRPADPSFRRCRSISRSVARHRSGGEADPRARSRVRAW